MKSELTHCPMETSVPTPLVEHSGENRTRTGQEDKLHLLTWPLGSVRSNTHPGPGSSHTKNRSRQGERAVIQCWVTQVWGEKRAEIFPSNVCASKQSQPEACQAEPNGMEAPAWARASLTLKTFSWTKNVNHEVVKMIPRQVLLLQKSPR